MKAATKLVFWTQIKTSTKLSEVVRIWLEKFEIPCTPGPGCDGEMNTRMPFAQSWADGKGDGAADGSGSAPPTTGCVEKEKTDANGSGESKGDFIRPLPKNIPVVR